jgi:hypothetical protein
MFEVDPVELRFDDVRELPAHPLSSVPRLHVRKSLSSLSRSLLGALIGSSPMLGSVRYHCLLRGPDHRPGVHPLAAVESAKD